MPADNRRPIASRNNRRIAAFAAALAARNSPTPNQISVLSAVFAALGALLLLMPHPATLLFCALMIQLRLLCNLLDGMVAVEGGKKTATGALYNEFPDRIADSLLLIAWATLTPWPWLGWLAALLALATAYIRVFGGSLQLPQSFVGPMAKQHRMAVLTAACILGAGEMLLWQTHHLAAVALIVIILGSALTCLHRTRLIARRLNAAPHKEQQ